ncbi:MAG: matrixin family metalloprotease, partial [Methanimicrococcus sp.]|nr:matrixin family metalloprotease [Methanimicrococcus sp.]
MNMKKSKIASIAMIGMLIFLFLIPIASANEFPPIMFSNGVQNLTINMSYDPNSSFNSSEKVEIHAAAKTWEAQGNNTTVLRKPKFYNSSTYNTTNGVSFKKGSLESNYIAICSITAFNNQAINYSQITFSTNYNWTTNQSQAGWKKNLLGQNLYYVCDLQSIALHELGHSLGIGHNSSNNSSDPAVMSSLAQVNGKRNLTAWDVYWFQMIYYHNGSGKSSGNPIGNDYLHLRNMLYEEQNDYEIKSTIFITYPPMDDNQMVDFSDLIIRGYVKGISSSWWNTSDGERPTTEEMSSYYLFHDVVITVDEVYKGEINKREITVRQMGGSLDDVHQTTSDQQYYEGEEVILYLVEGTSNDTAKPKHYYQINERAQLFVVDDNLAINGIG